MVPSSDRGPPDQNFSDPGLGPVIFYGKFLKKPSSPCTTPFLVILPLSRLRQSILSECDRLSESRGSHRVFLDTFSPVPCVGCTIVLSFRHYFPLHLDPFYQLPSFGVRFHLPAPAVRFSLFLE